MNRASIVCSVSAFKYARALTDSKRPGNSSTAPSVTQKSARETDISTLLGYAEAAQTLSALRIMAAVRYRLHRFCTPILRNRFPAFWSTRESPACPTYTSDQRLVMVGHLESISSAHTLLKSMRCFYTCEVCKTTAGTRCACLTYEHIRYSSGRYLSSGDAPRTGASAIESRHARRGEGPFIEGISRSDRKTLRRKVATGIAVAGRLIFDSQEIAHHATTNDSNDPTCSA